jgi:Tfp pilus assembly protein PilF
MVRRVLRTMWAGVAALLLAGWAAPAWAQNGTMSGRVLDSDRRITDRDGKPIAGLGKQSPTDFQLGLAGATVTLDLKSEPPRQFKVITDAFGEWYKSGLPPGTYNISVRLEYIDRSNRNLKNSTVPIIFIATAEGVVLKPGEKLRVPDMGALTEEARAAGRSAPVASNLSAAEAEASNRRQAEMEALFKEATVASEAGNHAEAVTKLTALAEKLEGDKRPCAECYVKIGESQLKLKDNEKAEAAFLKAIEMNPKLPAPYSQLAALYNGQRKFDEAAKMSDKAAELMGAGGAAGGGGGGGDATTTYNRGIINWNAGKYEDAKADFAKAAQMDPKMANAHYYLGMAIFNLASTGKGTLADAKAPFQEYLKLAPTGEYAEVAKAILATIK